MKQAVKVLEARFYSSRPDWVNGTLRFDALIRQRLKAAYRVLDLGAGGGKSGPVNFRGDVECVVGVDPDSVVGANRCIDRAVVGVAEGLPFGAGTFDVVFSDWVVEHLPNPGRAVAEVFRVLKPSGFFFFRTGNLLHYSYAIAASTPHWFHRIVANRVRALEADEAETHPTYYRMNTAGAVRRCLGAVGFIEEELLMIEPEPSYLMFSASSFMLGLAYERLVNQSYRLAGFRACIFGCFRKPKGHGLGGMMSTSNQGRELTP
jgi:SAM-dependent methyltransferase